MSLRLKLTLTCSILVALIVTVFGAILYSTMRRNLEQEMDRRLRVRASQVELTIWPGTSSLKLTDLAAAKLDLSPLADLDAPGLYVQVLDREGKVVATSNSLQDSSFPVAAAELASALEGKQSFTTVSVGPDHTVRVYSLPVTVGGRAVGILQVGQSRQPLEQTMTDLRTQLLLLGGAMLVIGGLLSWLVAHRGLRPLSTISRRAAAITAGRDFSGRLGMPQRRDEIGQLARTIDQLLATVDDLLRTHREFVADTSHELRNPLLAIRTNLELLNRVRGEAARAECVQEAHEQVERMTGLIEDLLMLARAESGQVIERRPVALYPLIRDVVREMGQYAHGRHLKLGHVEPVEVLGDRDRLRQVLINLVSNAVRHTPAGGEIRIELARDGEWVCLAVSDTGEGIPPEALPHVFDRFYQVGKQKGAAGGTGLGLAIVRHLIAAHGGRVTAASVPGRGSCFTVWLPACTGLPSAGVPLVASA